MTLNPATQYADDRNLRARQRLWQLQDPYFDIVGWALDLAAVAPGQQVLDVGCGNGVYLRAMQARGVDAVGCDLSVGMLRSVRAYPALVNADVVKLPFPNETFDVVLAPHMLYHVPDRRAAALELRRVLRSSGVCVAAVTNGAGHTVAMRVLVEEANPGWKMRTPATHVFSLENGAEQLRVAFDDVTCVRPEGVAPVVVRDAAIVADYVASSADHYESEAPRPWAEVVEHVREAVQRTIDTDAAFVVSGDPGAFVCH